MFPLLAERDTKIIAMIVNFPNIISDFSRSSSSLKLCMTGERLGRERLLLSRHCWTQICSKILLPYNPLAERGIRYDGEGKLRDIISYLIVGWFHVKDPRKKVNVKKWIFVNEMWKIIKQNYDIGRFLINFCNFGVFLAQNQKYPKITVLKKSIWKKKMFFF